MFMYCTVQELKDYLMDTSSEYDARYRSAIQMVSGIVNTVTGAAFLPCIDEREYFPDGECSQFAVDDIHRLLSVTADGTSVTATYRKRLITLSDNPKPEYVLVNAIFGDFSTKLSESTVAGDGISEFSVTPHQFPPDTFFIVEDEIFYYDGTNYWRGVNNSVTVAHPIGSSVLICEPPPSVKLLAMNMAIRLLSVPQSRMSQNFSPSGILTPDIMSSLRLLRKEFT